VIQGDQEHQEQGDERRKEKGAGAKRDGHGNSLSLVNRKVKGNCLVLEHDCYPIMLAGLKNMDKRLFHIPA
jgi:hypothetical protein